MVMLLQIRMVEEMVEMDVLLVEVARLEVALMLKEVQHPLVVEHRMCESVELLPQIEWLLQGAVAALVMIIVLGGIFLIMDKHSQLGFLPLVEMVVDQRVGQQVILGVLTTITQRLERLTLYPIFCPVVVHNQQVAASAKSTIVSQGLHLATT